MRSESTGFASKTRRRPSSADSSARDALPRVRCAAHDSPSAPNARFARKAGQWFAVRYTRRAFACTIFVVERLNITLDDEQAEKLARLADRMHIQPGTIARSLLSSALDEADPDARNVAALLDGIPGALERAELGREQAHAGETIPLDQL